LFLSFSALISAQSAVFDKVQHIHLISGFYFGKGQWEATQDIKEKEKGKTRVFILLVSLFVSSKALTMTVLL
jgi:hypothetical protein